MAYSVEFLRVPPEEMQGIGLAVLHRAGDRTVIYCSAAHISEPLTRSLTEQATRFSGATIRYDHPVSQRRLVRFYRVEPAEMPDNLSPQVSVVRDGEPCAYFRTDMITEELSHVLEQICAEETRYLAQIPVISPAIRGAPR